MLLTHYLLPAGGRWCSLSSCCGAGAHRRAAGQRARRPVATARADLLGQAVVALATGRWCCTPRVREPSQGGPWDSLRGSRAAGRPNHPEELVTDGRHAAVDDPGGSAAPTADAAEPSLQTLVEHSGLTRVHFLAWRDLADPEAGGSEVHADKVASAWAAAGLDVTMRTAAAAGQRAYGKRNGYSVVRKAGRYSVFPRTALSGALGRTGPRDGLVEIWNGMPFLSPLWARCPRIVFLHHVHAEMWRMVLPPHLARVGETIEFRARAAALPARRRSSRCRESSREEIHRAARAAAGERDRRAARHRPDVLARRGERQPHPLVVAVGRLVPVKRVDRLVDALLEAKQPVPGPRGRHRRRGLRAGRAGGQIARRRRAGLADACPGRVSDAELVALYRRAWVVTSASAREGWGMTLTEAAACGTPAVVTDIAGHRDAAAPGLSGLLVPEPEDLAPALARVLTDPAERARLSAGRLGPGRALHLEGDRARHVHGAGRRSRPRRIASGPALGLAGLVGLVGRLVPGAADADAHLKRYAPWRTHRPFRGARSPRPPRVRPVTLRAPARRGLGAAGGCASRPA